MLWGSVISACFLSLSTEFVTFFKSFHPFDIQSNITTSCGQLHNRNYQVHFVTNTESRNKQPQKGQKPPSVAIIQAPHYFLHISGNKTPYTCTYKLPVSTQWKTVPVSVFKLRN